MKILLINGPNLNNLGTREPAIYGSLTLNDIEARVSDKAASMNIDILSFQANDEGEIVDFLQSNSSAASGIIINAGALTHYGLSMRDALQATELPIIEVHISNIYAREEFRHHSVIADIAVGQISGLGWRGYMVALDFMSESIKEQKE